MGARVATVTATEHNTRELVGVRVVSVGHSVAARVAGMLFADLGAEVVALAEAGATDAPDEPGSVAWLRNVTSKTLQPGGPGSTPLEVEKLLASADVLLSDSDENLATWGLNRESLAETFPALVLGLMPPYQGPVPWGIARESHGLLAADMAISRRQSSLDGGPVDPVQPYVFYVQGAWAATGVMAALIERETSGWGQAVRVSAVQALVQMHVAALSFYCDTDDVDTRMGPGGRHPTYTRYEAGDGNWIVLGALGPKFVSMALSALELQHVLDDPRIGSDPNAIILPQNYIWVGDLVASRIAERSADEWIHHLLDHGVPCGPVLSPEQWFDHPQAEASGIRLDLDDDRRGSISVVAPPIQFACDRRDDSQSSTRSVPHPAARLLRAPLGPGPLHGVRILNVGTFVAVPYSGMLLAALGADVVKIEAPGGDPFRVPGFWINGGMRSAVVDLKQGPGLAAFNQMVRRSDVVIDGLRPGLTERLGIDHESLRLENGNLTALSLSAYGSDGPWAHLPGFDMVIQGVCGQMVAQGGHVDEPVANTIALNDVASAVMLALGACVGHFFSLRRGSGISGSVSIAAVSSFLQQEDLVRFAGRPPRIGGGADFRGPSVLDRHYRTRDGWLRVHGSGDDRTCREVREVFALGGSGIEGLEEVVAGLAGKEARAMFEKCGVASIPARTVTEVIRDRRLIEQGIFDLRTDPDGRVYTLPGRLIDFDRTPRPGQLRAPGTGEHTVAVLRACGLDHDQIQALLRDGIVAEGEPIPDPRLPVSYR